MSNPSLQIRYSTPTAGPAPILNALLGIKGETDKLVPSHNCIDIVHQDTSPQADLLSSPIEGEHIVFVDGSCSRLNDHTYYAGYAVVKLPDIVTEAQPIPYQSAQAAKLLECDSFLKGQEVNIYTDLHRFKICFRSRTRLRSSLAEAWLHYCRWKIRLPFFPSYQPP